MLFPFLESCGGWESTASLSRRPGRFPGAVLRLHLANEDANLLSLRAFSGVVTSSWMPDATHSLELGDLVEAELDRSLALEE